MVKKINKVRILERLRNRLDLTDLEREIFHLPELVMLTTDVGDLLKQWRIYSNTISRTHASGSGLVTFLTVPEGKKYRVRTIDIYRISGDMTITDIRITINDTTPIYTQTASANVKTGILVQDIPLEELNQLLMFCNAVTTDSTWLATGLYEEEEAF